MSCHSFDVLTVTTTSMSNNFALRARLTISQRLVLRYVIAVIIDPLPRGARLTKWRSSRFNVSPTFTDGARCLMVEFVEATNLTNLTHELVASLILACWT